MKSDLLRNPRTVSSETRHNQVRFLLLIVVCLIFFSPLIYAISTALKDAAQVMTKPRAFFPAPLHPENFLKVFENYAIERYFVNTFIVVGMAVVGNLVTSSLAGYAFSRISWKGRDFVFTATVATMFMPLFLLLLPRFLIFREVALLGTLAPLFIPMMLGSPTSIFLLRQFLKAIPMDMSESAYIDGCSEFRIYRSIILPLTKPALVTVVIFTVQWRWNDFVGPLIYLQSEKLYTVTMGLYQVMGTSAEEVTTHMVMAFLLVSVAPVIAIFIAAQRFFVQGSMMSGLKG
jgi:ABC-type glycerol-3-phosphate transport system permease component